MGSPLTDRLIAEGTRQLQARAGPVKFTKDLGANQLLNDLDAHPHAFVLACLGLRQLRAERAWLVPYLVRERLGSFEMAELRSLAESDWVRLLRLPTPAHRMPEMMAKVFRLAISRIIDRYEADASLLWSDRPASATLVRRLLEFHGAGPKIATTTANILVREFHVELADHRNIDISADLQVRRVMARLGLVDPEANADVVIYAARDLNPDFPGIFDLALWDIGRSVCRPRRPECDQCRLHDLCPFPLTHHSEVGS